MFGESMLGSIAIEEADDYGLNDYLNETADDMLDTIDFDFASESINTELDDEDIDEGDINESEAIDGNDAKPVHGVDDDPDPMDDEDDNLFAAIEQLDVVDPVNGDFHTEIDLEDNDVDNFLDFDIFDK